MKISIWMFISIGCVATSSCSTPNQVAKPSSITLDAAINEVADSLYRLQKKTESREKVGLIVDEATVEFNVAASATNTTTTGGGLTVIPTSIGQGGLSVSNELTNTGSRGNTIKVTFKNIATADYSKGGAEMAARCAKNPKAEGCPRQLFRAADPAK